MSFGIFACIEDNSWDYAYGSFVNAASYAKLSRSRLSASHIKGIAPDPAFGRDKLVDIRLLKPSSVSFSSACSDRLRSQIPPHHHQHHLDFVFENLCIVRYLTVLQTCRYEKTKIRSLLTHSPILGKLLQSLQLRGTPEREMDVMDLGTCLL